MMKSVLIIGGSRGIGRQVAVGFLRDGFGVTIVGRDRKQLMGAEEELASAGSVQGYAADVSLFDDVECAIELHMARYKGLDVVVNTAAVQGPIGQAWEVEPDQWAKNISTNLIGSFNVCRAAVPKMIEAGVGVMIFFSGGGAAYARPRFSAYGVGKTGVLRLVETIHEEILEFEALGVRRQEKGIRVYAVAPGAVRTRMTEEVLSHKDSAGAQAFAEAVRTNDDGGTPAEKAVTLCLFLAKEMPACLSGRLIHVNEPYREYVARLEDKNLGEMGMLRRVGYTYASEE